MKLSLVEECSKMMNGSTEHKHSYWTLVTAETQHREKTSQTEMKDKVCMGYCHMTIVKDEWI